MTSKGRQRCGRCKRTLAMDKFYPSRQNKKGKWCRQCFKEYQLRRKWASRVGPWKVLLDRGRRARGTDLIHFMLSCERCHRLVRPYFRKSEIDELGSTFAVVLRFACGYCTNQCVLRIALRHARSAARSKRATR